LKTPESQRDCGEFKKRGGFLVRSAWQLPYVLPLMFDPVWPRRPQSRNWGAGPKQFIDDHDAP
jgi:hypothetical protein